jgi:hypothetical protein
MMSFSKTAALASAGLIAMSTEALGARMDAAVSVTGPGSQQVKKLFTEDAGVVCGSHEIHDHLSSDSSVDRIRSLPWSQVMTVAENYVTKQQGNVKVLQAELAAIQERVDRALKAEKPKPLGVNEIKAAVTAAVSAQGSYGSVAKAAATQCGAIRPKNRADRAPTGAYEAADAAFKAGVPGMLKGGLTRVEGDKLRSACESLLQASGDETFCRELCQSFADAAQAVSDSTVVGSAGSGPSADELLKQAQEKAAQLKLAQTQLSECQEAQTDLSAFRNELEGLQVVIKDEFEKVRAAKSALYDADDEMAILEEDLEAQAETVKNLEEVLAGKTQILLAAQAELEKVAQQNANLQTAITAGQGSVKEAVEQVRRASAASQAAQELRGQVSTLMLKMALYFDAAVRKPIRDLGLGEGVVISDYFPSNVRNLPEADVTQRSLSVLRNFCDSESTRKAFSEAVGGKAAALEELCSFGSVGAVDKEIDDSIASRVTALKADLNQVQSWLNEYRGEASMTAEQAQKNVEGGEPAGLRQVSTIIDATNFYTGYLVHWKVDAKFVKLLASLEESVATTKASQAQFEEALKQLQTQLAAGIEAYKAAAAAVKAATDSKQIAADKLNDAKDEYNALVAEQKALEDKLAALEDALAAAQAAYQAAIASLQTSHAEATAFMQMLQSIQPGALPSTNYMAGISSA